MAHLVFEESFKLIHSILSATTQIKANAICDPVSYYQTIFRLQACILKTIAQHQYDIPKHSFFEQAQQNCTALEQQALAKFDEWLTPDYARTINLSNVYELMLLLDFPVVDGQLRDEFESIDSVDSFYTPPALAAKIVALTIDNYLFQQLGIQHFSTAEVSKTDMLRSKELLQDTTFADYSCGTGNFLLAILQYCRVLVGMSHSEISVVAGNLFAIEPDLCALEIAKLRMTQASNTPQFFETLNTQFVHGNPLISPSDEYPNYTYSHACYYHNNLALESSEIKKCDIIVGNPPWGRVEFDFQYYFHTLCPNLNKLKTEEKLETAFFQIKKTHPLLHQWFCMHDEAVDVAMENIYNDSRFDFSTMGGLHTNTLFTELCARLSSPYGSVGLFLNGATLTKPINQRLVNFIQDEQRVQARYDLNNTQRIFNVSENETFSILILGNNKSGEIVHRINLTSIHQLGV